MSLLPPSDNQAYCDVSALEAGFIEIPLEWAIDTAQPGQRNNLPALSFLLRHSRNNDIFVFDLGIRKDWHNSTPGYLERIKHMTFRIDVPQDAVESLAKGGTRPEDVTHVCISHVHFDHIGDTRPYTRATFVVSEGARALVADGYPQNPASLVPADLLPEGRTRFLAPDDWPPLGPFEHAFDFYGDGSLYIVDAGPGHLPGHINVLARTSPDGGWVYLAGDSAHDRKLLTGEARIPHHDVFGCAHRDPEKSAAHIARIRALMEADPRVRVILAHDHPWYEENKDKDAFWPGKLDSL